MPWPYGFPYTFPIFWFRPTTGPFLIQVVVAFSSDPFDINPTWTDITKDVRRVLIKRGRQNELNRMEAGTAIIELNNFDGDYWPLNAASPHSPYVKPGKLVQIRTGYLGMPYYLYTGYVESWKPSWLSETGAQKPLMTLKCADLIKNLAKHDQNNAGYPQELSGHRVGHVLNDLGFVCIHLADDTTNRITSPDAADLDTVITLLNEMKANYNTHLADTTVHMVADGVNTVGSPDATNLATALTLVNEMWADYANHFVGDTFHLKADTYNVWWTGPATNLAECIAMANEGKASINGHFLYQKCRLDHGQSEMIATGAQVDANAMTHLFLVQDSELGIMYPAGDGRVQVEGRHHRLFAPHTVSQATFGDDTGENYYHDLEPEFDDGFIYNDVRITRSGGAQQAASDAASIAAYGNRSFSRTGLIMVTDAEAADMAEYLKRRYKDPALRPSTMKILGERDPNNLWPKLLGYDISTRITLRLNQADIDKDYFIEGVTHSIDVQKGTWATFWDLSDAETASFWALGVPGLGELGVATYLCY